MDKDNKNDYNIKINEITNGKVKLSIYQIKKTTESDEIVVEFEKKKEKAESTNKLSGNSISNLSTKTTLSIITTGVILSVLGFLTLS